MLYLLPSERYVDVLFDLACQWLDMPRLAPTAAHVDKGGDLPLAKASFITATLNLPLHALTLVTSLVLSL